MPPIRDWFRFVYLDEEGISEAGLTDEHLGTFEAEVVNDPAAGDVIAGTGGLRKLRLALPGRGKSGGCRVCYAMFLESGVVVVPLVYPKSQKANLTPADKKRVKQLLAAYGELLRGGENAD